MRFACCGVGIKGIQTIHLFTGSLLQHSRSPRPGLGFNYVVHGKKVLTTYIVQKVENMSIETKNHELVEEKTKDKTSNKMDYEDEMTAKKDDVKCLLDGIEEPDWIKEENWRSFANNGLQEAILWNTIHKKKKYIPDLGKTVPTIKNDSFVPQFISGEIKVDPMAPILIDYERLLLPFTSSGPTIEELKKNPNVLALQEAVRNGGVLVIKLKDPSGIYRLPK